MRKSQFGHIINNALYLFPSITDCLLLQRMKTKGIIEEPIDLTGMAERRNVTHNYKLLGSVCAWMQMDHTASDCPELCVAERKQTDRPAVCIGQRCYSE